MATVDLKTKDLQTTLNTRGIVLIDCWAPWCAPCRLFGPVFERVSERHPDIVFAKANVEEEPGISRAFDVRGIPTLVVFREGVPLLEQAGMVTERVLEELIKHVRALNMDEVRAELGRAEADDRRTPEANT